MTTLIGTRENHSRGYAVTFRVTIDSADDAPQPCELIEALGEFGPEDVSAELRELLERDVDIELSRQGTLWESLLERAGLFRWQSMTGEMR